MQKQNVILEAIHLQKKYRKKQVLQDVNFTVYPGECVGIVGNNGCGKTTLLRILCGSHRASDGAMILEGEKKHFRRRAAQAIGYVPQDNPLMEDLTVRDNLRFWYSDTNIKADEDIVSGTSAFLGLAPCYRSKVATLSGGQKKRLSIACALAKRPKILIMDEPGASLDLLGKEEMKEYLSYYKRKGGTILLISHELQELELCDRMYLLQDGVLTELDKNVPLEQLYTFLKKDNQ